MRPHHGGNQERIPVVFNNGFQRLVCTKCCSLQTKYYQSVRKLERIRGFNGENVAKETMGTQRKNNPEVLFSGTYTRFPFQSWKQ